MSSNALTTISIEVARAACAAFADTLEAHLKMPVIRTAEEFADACEAANEAAYRAVLGLFGRTDGRARDIAQAAADQAQAAFLTADDDGEDEAQRQRAVATYHHAAPEMLQ